MCLSAEVSFAAAAILIPSGTVAIYCAWRYSHRYLAIAALPALFGLQQLVEGLIWTAGHASDAQRVSQYSLLYMFFTWVVWPIWVPISAYFIESGGRKNILVLFVIVGAMLGGLQYVPYYVHQGWLSTSFLALAVRYQDINLLDFIVHREATYAIYLFAVVTPFFVVRDPEIKIFGLLVAGVLIVTYVFFSFAYISVFCFGGAIISLYLLVLIWRKAPPATPLARFSQ
jgi:hypothetical protein